MRLADFDYELPAELIAQRPAAQRGESRLLCLSRADGAVADRRFADLPQLLRPGDLLVFNDTRVIPARMHGVKDSGGKVEVLLERVLDSHRARVQIRASKPPRAGTRLTMEGAVRLEVLGREDDLYEVRFDDPRPVIEVLEASGHVPLPPYIERADEAGDRERYQTVYARRPGAVAAPTAGLHFDRAILDGLAAAGVEHVFVTLHVGAGTFQPVRVERIESHRMHPEYVEVGAQAAERVRAAREEGRRVIAVGTTAVRSLEAAAAGGTVAPFTGDTDLFIYPGYRFRAVDAMITNFHLPGSTLLMLVCAFGGREHVLAAYRHAVAQRYRFYSYGDAMFVY